MARAPIPMPHTAAPAGAYLGAKTPVNPFQQFFGSKSGANALMGLGAGLLSGNLGNAGLYAMQGAQADAEYTKTQKEEAERKQQLNQTVEWARNAFPDVLANVPEHLAGDLAVDLWKKQFLPEKGGTNYGLTPIYGVDANGQPTIAQLSDQGGLQPVQMPEGFRVSKDPIKMDAGDHWVLLDPVTRGQIGVIPKSGDVPAGYQQTGDGAIAPMPGSPQQAEIDAAARANAQRVRSLNERADLVIGKVDEALGQVAWDSTGLVGQVMGNVAGSKAFDLRKTVDTVIANIGFAELQAMREASPTGGALGQVAVQELQMLQSVLASLNADQSTPQMAANLAEVKRLLERQKMFREEASRMGAPAGGGSGGYTVIEIGRAHV